MKVFWSGLVGFVVVGGVLVAVASCTVQGPYAVCHPATVIECTSAACNPGHMVCNENGTGYGGCTCTSESAGGSGSGGSGGGSGEGGSDAGDAGDGGNDGGDGAGDDAGDGGSIDAANG